MNLISKFYVEKEDKTVENEDENVEKTRMVDNGNE